jgi:hypothetical protein
MNDPNQLPASLTPGTANMVRCLMKIFVVPVLTGKLMFGANNRMNTSNGIVNFRANGSD